MTFADWIADPVNWAYLAIGAAVVSSAFRVVTSQNVVHAALFLVATLAGSAALFLMLSAEFVAWALVLVYIGAVVVLFLFGIMITRAPLNVEPGLDNPRSRPLAAVLSIGLFALLAYSSLQAFGAAEIPRVGEPTDTADLAEALIVRFLIPFEVVGFVLLAALIGGITIARRDLTPLEEEERGSV